MIDFFILVALFIFLVLGFFRGLKKEIFSIINFSLFFIVSYFYADFIGTYLITFSGFDSSNIPSYTNLILGYLLIFITTSTLMLLIKSIFFSPSSSFGTTLFDKIFGSFFGLIKGLIFICISFLFCSYYDDLDFITNFDNNSLFLDYFLHYGVQLQNVWNHWNS
tara:strand:- start:544 stop:1035 length:492 start_codon:yes stop_codon:yes gene_type:complete